MKAKFSQTTQAIIDDLKREGFEVTQEDRIFHCRKSGYKEIKFVPSYDGIKHLFNICNKHTWDVDKAIDLARVDV